MKFRLRTFELLTAPAFGYIWCVARLLGYNFECGPAHQDEELPAPKE